MTYTDTSDLTDAEIEAAAKECQCGWTVSRLRAANGDYWNATALFALARANKRIAALEDLHEASLNALNKMIEKRDTLQAEFDAYRKDVAEAVKWPFPSTYPCTPYAWNEHFARFAAPEPDLLAEVLTAKVADEKQFADGLRQAAASKGYVIEVRKADHDQE